jgi:hypothetical protein
MTKPSTPLKLDLSSKRKETFTVGESRFRKENWNCVVYNIFQERFLRLAWEFHGSPPDGRRQNYENGVP